jgi:hypothetical protein
VEKKMQLQFNVLQLRVDFTVSLEEIVQGRIGVIYKSLGRWAARSLLVAIALRLG